MPSFKATVRLDLEKVTVHSTLIAAIKQVILKIKELLLIIDVLLNIAIEKTVERKQMGRKSTWVFRWKEEELRKWNNFSLDLRAEISVCVVSK